MIEDEHLSALIAKHAKSGLLIDTNLLLLLGVGNYSRRRISSFKRTAAYDQNDYKLLSWLTSQFRQLWTTPNTLTEVDNLGRQLHASEWPMFAESMSGLVIKMTEEFVNSSKAMKSGVFARLGLTDTVTLSTGQSFLLLSDDVNLYLAAQAAKYDAINFNHLRS